MERPHLGSVDYLDKWMLFPMTKHMMDRVETPLGVAKLLKEAHSSGDGPCRDDGRRGSGRGRVSRRTRTPSTPP